MKIRIAHVLYSFGIGGLEGVLAELINRMDPGVFSHVIYIFSNDASSLNKIKREGVELRVIRRFFPHDPSTIIRLAIALKKSKPDIVRTYNWAGMEGIVAARLAGISNIIHSEHGFDIAEIYKKKNRRIIARRILLNKCVKVIAVSKGLQEWLVGDVNVDAGKVVYIPNGCDTVCFRPGKDLELRRSLGISDADTVIGTVGSLVALKDQRSLIEAFVRVAGSRNDVRLMIVGEGPLRKELESFAGTADVKERMIFTGNVVDPEKYYRAMDIFVLPSLSENMPNVLLQAMATALPIVATDVGDVRHMLDGEKGGIIVSPKDVEALASGIKQFLAHPDAAKGKGVFARRRVEDEFSMTRIKDVYEKLYRSLSG